MQIINKSKKTVISTDAKELKSLVDKSLGLLKKSNPRSLFFETRFGIHTFFLKDPIEVLILDENYVVQKSVVLYPNKVYFWPINYPYVVELSKGIIKKSKTEIGDKLEFV